MKKSANSSKAEAGDSAARAETEAHIPSSWAEIREAMFNWFRVVYIQQ